MNSTDLRSLTPDFPEYAPARYFLRVIDGVPYGLFRGMVNSIWEQRGNPKETVEWTEPESWIPQRLQGEEQALALRIWRESHQAVNPRYTRGSWYLANRHELLKQSEHERLSVTDKGRRFIEEEAGVVTSEVDDYEGVLMILRLVAERGPGKRSDFLPDFTSFCQATTNYRSDSPIKGALYDRLRNLLSRDYIQRSGQIYAVTDRGLKYLERYPGRNQPKPEKQSSLRKLAQDIRQQARLQLAEHLADMDAFKFEELIKFLLEEMGYAEVVVTSPTNDKGVDVVANIELGISSVREVVQVKRHKGNLSRPVLDQLRGSLHRFNAVRGTIITTGGFSKGMQDAAFERGAAPITLIDGDKLLDLLIENSIGVRKQAVEYFEFDPVKLAQFGSRETDDN